MKPADLTIYRLLAGGYWHHNRHTGWHKVSAKRYHEHRASLFGGPDITDEDDCSDPYQRAAVWCMVGISVVMLGVVLA